MCGTPAVTSSLVELVTTSANFVPKTRLERPLHGDESYTLFRTKVKHAIELQPSLLDRVTGPEAFMDKYARVDDILKDACNSCFTRHNPPVHWSPHKPDKEERKHHHILKVCKQARAGIVQGRWICYRTRLDHIDKTILKNVEGKDKEGALKAISTMSQNARAELKRTKQHPVERHL